MGSGGCSRQHLKDKDFSSSSQLRPKKQHNLNVCFMFVEMEVLCEETSMTVRLCGSGT